MNNKNIENEINIVDAAEETSYPNKNKEFIISLIYDEFLLNEAYDIFLVPKKLNKNSPAEKFFVIRYKIPVNLKEKIYYVPVLIHLLKSFPETAPDVYIERNQEIGVNPKYGTVIDQFTFKININSIQTWNPNTTTVSKLMELLFVQFSNIFPVYLLPPNNRNKRDPSLDINCTIPQIGVFKVTQNAKAKVIEKSNLNNNYINNIYIKNPTIINKPTNNITEEKISKQIVNTNTNVVINSNNSNQNEKNESSLKLPDSVIKKLLIDELNDKLIKRVIDQRTALIKINQNILEERSVYQAEIEKISKIVDKKDEILKTFDSLTSSVNAQINSLKLELQEIKINEEKASNDIEGLIKIDNKNILRLIAIESTLDEILKIIKKGFEKKLLSFDESCRNTRLISREILKVIVYRRKLQNLY